MSIGHRVMKLRQKAQMTQSELSAASDLTVSYLSRIENNHVTPSIPTLSKVAAAVKVPLSAFFTDNDCNEREEDCPISLSGECILDQCFVPRGRRPSAGSKPEGYSAEQLSLLRLCNYLLHSQDREVVTNLSVTMRSLLAFVDQFKDTPGVMAWTTLDNRGGKEETQGAVVSKIPLQK